jgi:hypothetical protein
MQSSVDVLKEKRRKLIILSKRQMMIMSTLHKAALAIASGSAALLGASLVSGTATADDLPSTNSSSTTQTTQTTQASQATQTEHTADTDELADAKHTQQVAQQQRDVAADAAKRAQEASKSAAQLAEHTAQQKAAAQQEAQKAAAQQALAQQAKEQASAKAEHAEELKQKAIQDANAKIAQDQAREKQAQEDVAGKNDAADAAQARVDHQTKTLADAQTDVSAKTADKAEAKAKLDEASQSVTSSQSALDTAKTGSAKGAAALAAARQRVTDAQTKADTANETATQAQADVDEAQKTTDEAQTADDTATENLAKASDTARANKPAITADNASTIDFFNEIGTASTLLTDPSYQPWLAQHPEWQKLGAVNDATTMANLLASTEGLRKLNEIRASLGLSQLKVSAWLTADAQSHAAYSGGEYWELGTYSHANQDYPDLPLNSSENIAVNRSWSGAYKAWYDDEKVIWDAAVAKDPSLTAYLSDPNGPYKLFKNNYDLYEQVGHYLNIIDPTLATMGMAQSYNPQTRQFSYSQDMSSFATNGETLYSVDEWESLVRDYIAALSTKGADISKDAGVIATTAAKKEADEKLAAVTTAQAQLQKLEASTPLTTSMEAVIDAAQAKLNETLATQASALAAYDSATKALDQAEATRTHHAALLADYTAALDGARSALGEAQQTLTDAQAAEASDNIALAKAVASDPVGEARTELAQANVTLQASTVYAATTAEALTAITGKYDDAQRALKEANSTLATLTANVQSADATLKKAIRVVALLTGASDGGTGASGTGGTNADAGGTGAGGAGAGGTDGGARGTASGTGDSSNASVTGTQAKLYAAIRATTADVAPSAPPIDHTDYAIAPDGSLTEMPQTGADVSLIAALMVSAALAGAGALELQRKSGRADSGSGVGGSRVRGSK